LFPSAEALRQTLRQRLVICLIAPLLFEIGIAGR
jgi:hypothetical protein